MDEALHPRIRARRAQVQREVIQRRMRLALGITVVVGVVTGGWGVTRSAALDVDAINVHGADRTGRPAVLAATGVARGQAMTDVDPDIVQAALEQLPWVAGAEVRRRWPGTVEIKVRERAAVAALAVADRWALLAADGTVLELTEGPPGAVAVHAEVDADLVPGTVAPGWPASAAGLAHALPAEVAARVSAITADAHGLRLHLHGGVEAHLGGNDQQAEKLTALATLLARIDLRRVAVIDVRVPAAPALTRR